MEIKYFIQSVKTASSTNPQTRHAPGVWTCASKWSCSCYASSCCTNSHSTELSLILNSRSTFSITVSLSWTLSSQTYIELKWWKVRDIHIKKKANLLVDVHRHQSCSLRLVSFFHLSNIFSFIMQNKGPCSCLRTQTDFKLFPQSEQQPQDTEILKQTDKSSKSSHYYIFCRKILKPWICYQKYLLF